MNTTASRGLIALVAAPLVAATIVTSAVEMSAVAYAASVVPGVNTHASGMALSKEYIAEQKEQHGASAKPIDLQMQQQAAQPDSPAKQEANELKGDIKAEEPGAPAPGNDESRVLAGRAVTAERLSGPTPLP